jgi:GTP:adenosylcobinamide-phosphate guanylyltransferase
MIDAVVLAGGVDRGELAAHTGVSYRPLLEVGGRPIISAVLAALCGTTTVGKVVLVAPDAVQEAAPGDAVDVRVRSGESLVENISLGVQALPADSSHLLLLTGDMPFISPAAIDDFLRQSLATKSDLCYPIITKAACERRFPGTARTYVRIREGVFTGGNGIVASRGFLSQGDLIGRLYAARKNPLKLATLFGARVVLGLLTGRVALHDLEARASAIISGKVSAVISTYAELGFDVDKLHDLDFARRIAQQ